MGRPKKNQDETTNTPQGVTNEPVAGGEVSNEKTAPAETPAKEGLEEVTLEKLIVVDDVEYPKGSKMKVTKEGKKGLISIGAVKG